MTSGGYTKTEAWNLQLQHKIEKAEKRIAALEAALKKIQDLEINGVSNIARFALEGAPTSSEGAGGCTCPYSSEHRMREHNPECPIHSPTSASEGREDG